MTLEDARTFALSLPQVTEEPHFEKLSWRCAGKIFATVPTEANRLHIFLNEIDVRALVEEEPAVYEELRWGKKIVGVRAQLEVADADQVRELLREAWELQAPETL